MLTYTEYKAALNPGMLVWKNLPNQTREQIRVAKNVQCWDTRHKRWIDESNSLYRRFWGEYCVYRINPAGTDQYLKATNIDPEIKVTKIKRRWHARLIFQGTVRDEMACECTEDIGLICKEMLRWFHKMGNQSEYADRARHRASTFRLPKGKIWYRPQLEQEKLKRMEARNG